MRYNERGEELPDPTPVEIPAGFKQPESLQSMIARLVRTHVSDAAARHGFETVDEANDFDIEDEDFPETRYEVLGDEQLEAVNRERAEKKLAERALQRAQARRAGRNAGSQGAAASTKQADRQHVPSGSGRDDGGQRGPSGDGHLGKRPQAEGGSE